MRLVTGRCSSVASRSQSAGRARHWGATAAAAGLLLLAGCTTGGSSGAPSANATLVVAASPGIPSAPLYVASRDGMFGSAGLRVTIHSYPSFRAEVAALENGTADIAFGDYADLFYTQEGLAARHRPGMVIVADGYDAAPNVVEVLTLPNSGITSPRNLVGKVIGTPRPQVMADNVAGRPYSLETLATQSVLYNDNVSPARVGWRAMPTPDLINALRTRQVDAILATEPTIYQAESELGALPVLDSCTGETANLPLDGYFTSQSYAKAHPSTIAAFQSALRRAQAAAGQTKPVLTALESQSFADVKPQTASLVTIGEYPTSLKASNLARIASLMFFFGTLRHQVDVASMIAP